MNGHAMVTLTADARETIKATLLNCRDEIDAALALLEGREPSVDDCSDLYEDDDLDDLGGGVHELDVIPTPKRSKRRTREQLDALKQRRNAETRIGSHGMVETEYARKTTRAGKYLPSLDELCAELRRIAMGGTMPSVTTFDKNRPANWTVAQGQINRLGMTWNELAKAAGLKPNPSKHDGHT